MRAVRLVVVSGAIVSLIALASAGSTPASVPDRADPLATTFAVQTKAADREFLEPTSTPASTPTLKGPEATVAALETRVAELEGDPSPTPKATERATSTPRPRTSTPTPRPRRPTPTPTPTLDEIVADYPVIPDIRELAIRPGDLVGEKLAFSGTVTTIRVAAPGNSFVLGDADPVAAEVTIQVSVVALDGSSEVVFVGYTGDTEGIFEGSFVSVYGTVNGTQTFENLYGGGVTQPLVIAELVTLA